MTYLNLSEEDYAATSRELLGTGRISAPGHIGTHLDCYTAILDRESYTHLEAVVPDCLKVMPCAAAFNALPSLKGRVLILHTGNEEENRYGSEAYFKRETFLSEEALLAKSPLFIIVDSHGLNQSGVVHKALDVKCERHGCHVIENVSLKALTGKSTVVVSINVDFRNTSTGKPCTIELH